MSKRRVSSYFQKRPRRKKFKSYKSKREQFREKLVKRATKSEKSFKAILKALRFKFEFQKVIDKPTKGFYIVDFYIPSLNLIIEVDGGYHNYRRQARKDKYREEVLRTLGYKIKRLTNKEVQSWKSIDIKKYLTDTL